MGAAKRPADKDRHELQQRARHQQAQPAERDRVNQRQGLGRLNGRGRISVAEHHHRLANYEKGECGRKIGHGPAGKRGPEHLHSPG
ncbi:hypothetical protein GGE07_003110 [Sinorhizobium terangae]|uniref:hypothetical protein n=1 Tax=Sinorhizobium terangae TaxID=110322 RepID=UPI0017BEE4C5|nr:hypothetical protein [Sinorhizobium terangae]MBB4186451.1 hypothetical protein [Sinorhizobium terangae]